MDLNSHEFRYPQKIQDSEYGEMIAFVYILLMLCWMDDLIFLRNIW